MSKKKIISLVFIIILILIAIITFIFLINKKEKDKIIPTDIEEESTKLVATEVVDVGKIFNYATLTSRDQDESVLLVKGDGYLTLRNSAINKESGDISDKEKAKSLGLNSAIVVTYDSYATIINSKVLSSATGANGIYSIGTKSLIDILNTTIETYYPNSSAIFSTQNGEINGENLTITTKVKTSPGLESSKNGHISLVKSHIETNGSSSPLIESSANISLNESTGSANGSRIAVLTDESNVVINNSTLIASGAKGDEEFTESGILIFDNNLDKEKKLKITNSSLNINQNLPYYKIASLINVSSSKANIELTNVSLNYGSNILLSISNKSKVTLNVTDQTLSGKIEIDNNSNITMNLHNSSYEGSINNNNSIIKLDSKSKLKLTSDTYIKELENEDSSNSNINFNGFKLYVNGICINF